MTSSSRLARFAHTQLRFLAFRSAPIAPADRSAFLALALVCTWIAGIGRVWDAPAGVEVAWWRAFGLGSIAYVFLLAGALWLATAPLRVRGCRYIDLVLMVALTAPLAWLYALPIERFVPRADARTINAWFLIVVAVWRVALWLRHLRVVAELRRGLAWSVGLFPLATIVLALVVYGIMEVSVMHRTFELMAEGSSAQVAEPSAPGPNGEQRSVLLDGIVSGLVMFLPLYYPCIACAYFIAVALRRTEKPQ